MPDKLLSADPAAGVLLSTDANAGVATTSTQPSNGGSIAATATAALPIVQAGAEELATNPNAWKLGRTIGSTVGFLAGAQTLDPLKAAAGMWVGGKAGWRLTNAAQRVAAPVAKALKAMEPFTASFALGLEGARLRGQLESPEGIGMLAKKSNPPARARLLEHFADQPEYVTAIKNAIGKK